MALLAAGLQGLLVVYGEVVERKLTGAGMTVGGVSTWTWDKSGCLVPAGVGVAMVITTDG